MTRVTGTMEELVIELRTNGVWAAYRASREVCDNPDAPANARVTGASNILRAAGFFALPADAGSTKEPSEMSHEELSRAAAAVMQKYSASDDGGKDDPGGGVFD